MIIIRSFDVNKPGEDAETLKGGVAGGTILKGVLKVGDKISKGEKILARGNFRYDVKERETLRLNTNIAKKGQFITFINNSYPVCKHVDLTLD